MKTERRPSDRITVLNAVPDDRFGGPQNRVLQVAGRLMEQGVTTLVVMPAGDPMFARLLDQAGIPNRQLRSFRRLPNPSNVTGVFLWLLFIIPCIFKLVWLIRKNGIDIVHVNGAYNVQVAVAARLARAKLLWHLNDVRRSVLARPMSVLFRVLPHKLAGSSQAVARCYFGEGGNSRMRILYPPVDTDRFYSDAALAEKYRKELGIRQEESVIGIVGNFNPFKGYEYFFRAAALIRRETGNVKFLAIGKKLDTHERYWQKVRSLITGFELEGDIIFTGHRTDICGMLNAMDLFVLPSLFESFSMVTAEAMACAKPVVATRCGGPEEIAIDGESAVLVPPRDSEQIARNVLFLMKNPERARQLGMEARKRIIEGFDLNICADRHLELYRQMY